MRRRSCAYCTLRDNVTNRKWIRLDWIDGEGFDFCSFFCLADWTEERELALQERLTA